MLPDGTSTTAHIANTGKMTNCLEPNARCRLWRSSNPKRKLPWSVEQVAVGERWILVNTGRANDLVGEALRDGRVVEVPEGDVRGEPTYPEGGRADFLVAGRVWVEVKNVTLLDGETLFFPDTVSVRAVEHLEKLKRVVERGHEAVLLLHVGTEGGAVVRPAWQLDRRFAEALVEAAAAGVCVTAYRSEFDAEGARLGARVPVDLHP